ncbi:hypothetical protein HU200_037352 [Digitaria exilis]|uniref:Uncharacterized protein n=1 Tax=Digitaria exilis TaxID=1010633 RepID=A0A835BM14_9POAL|nr:hypothetical protein HU200_037352 [Digitaria exilis]
MVSSFLVYWAELQQQDNRKAQEEGAESLKNMAIQLHPQQASPYYAGTVLIR